MVTLDVCGVGFGVLRADVALLLQLDAHEHHSGVQSWRLCPTQTGAVELCSWPSVSIFLILQLSSWKCCSQLWLSGQTMETAMIFVVYVLVCVDWHSELLCSCVFLEACVEQSSFGTFHL